MRTCSVDGCDGPAAHRDWCSSHYMRWRRHGDPLAGRTKHGELRRYLEEVVLPYVGDDCLIWPYERANGYATMYAGGRTTKVTRIICERLYGPAPTPEHHAAHSCGHGDDGCVAPRHLRWATPAENEADKLLHGTHHRGERHANSKLSDSDARKIIEARGEIPGTRLAEIYGVSKVTISQIQNGRTWTWLRPASGPTEENPIS